MKGGGKGSFLAAEHGGGQQADDTARTLDSSEVLCPEPRVAEGPLLPFRRPSNVG